MLPRVQTQTIQAAFPFLNYVLHLDASNAFSLQTAVLINNRRLLLDSPRGGEKHTTAPYYDSPILAASCSQAKQTAASAAFMFHPPMRTATLQHSHCFKSYIVLVCSSWLLACAQPSWGGILFRKLRANIYLIYLLFCLLPSSCQNRFSNCLSVSLWFSPSPSLVTIE